MRERFVMRGWCDALCAIRGAHLPPRASSKLDSHMIFFGFNKAGETRVRVRSQVSPIHLSPCKTIAASTIESPIIVLPIAITVRVLTSSLSTTVYLVTVIKWHEILVFHGGLQKSMTHST